MPAAKNRPTCAAQFLAGPMRDVEEIVFAARSILHEHWYANIGYWAADRCRPMYGKFGKLCKLNLRTGKLTLLIDDPRAASAIRPCITTASRSSSPIAKAARRITCCYVINADGTGLRRITDGKFDDYEPCWLPDGGIAFVTTRAKRWVNCWSTQVGNIWRCDADGGQIRPLSANIEQDNTPWVLPDGRILYMRWEYIDRSQVNYHHLWTMYPDGTEQSVFFGNLHPGGVFIDARPIPGSRDVILINSPGHGRTEHAGYRRPGQPATGARRARQPGQHQQGGRLPRSLGVQRRRLHGGGKRAARADERPRRDGDALHRAEGVRPGLAARTAADHAPRPSSSPSRRGSIWPSPTGKYLLEDVYRGRNMSGIQAGEIKRLMVIESLPKPINFTGGMDPLSYAGTFTLERVLGTVPVEADGSAFFEAPALRSLFFVALDEQDLAVKRMQSFTTVQPGETAGCVGCHEHRTDRAAFRASPDSACRPAEGQPRSSRCRDVPEVADFPRDVQPILDRNCVQCHDYDRRDGGVILSGDHGPMFSHSYYTLTVWRQLADGRNQPQSNYAAADAGQRRVAVDEDCWPAATTM